MFQFQSAGHGNVLMIKADMIVAVKARLGGGSQSDTMTTIYCLGEHRFEVRGLIDEVLEKLQMKI